MPRQTHVEREEKEPLSPGTERQRPPETELTTFDTASEQATRSAPQEQEPHGDLASTSPAPPSLRLSSSSGLLTALLLAGPVSASIAAHSPTSIPTPPPMDSPLMAHTQLSSGEYTVPIVSRMVHVDGELHDGQAGGRAKYEFVKTSSPDEEEPPMTKMQALAARPFFQIIIAGAGFTCDAYDLFVMNLVIVLLGFQYNQTKGDSSLIADAVLVGSVVGQLAFGVLADHIGRRIGFICTLTLLTVGAGLSACSFQSGGFTIFQCLALWRFVLGVGIGGEYPLAATVSSEASSQVEGRGRRVAGVFSMQGVGSLLAPCVVLALLAMTGPGEVAIVWRAALALGALPGLIMIYFRLQMKESNVFKQSQRKAAQDAADSGTVRQSTWASICSGSAFTKYKQLGAHWKDLMGTAGNWFIFDVVFYANGLFSSTVLSHWYNRPDGRDSDAVHSYLLEVGVATLILAVCALPGYWCSMFAIDVLGRRKLQLIGYAGMIVSYTLCGALLPVLGDQKGAFFFLYGLTFFFCNFGPNVTTFVIPSEIFPTSVRATAHGLSAAAGKCGAVLGGALMPLLLARTGEDEEDSAGSLAKVMYLCAGISAFGGIWTLIFTRESQHLQLNAPNLAIEDGLDRDMQSVAVDPPTSSDSETGSRSYQSNSDERELSVAEST